VIGFRIASRSDPRGGSAPTPPAYFQKEEAGDDRMSDVAIGQRRQPFALRFPSVMIFLAILALFTVGVTILSEGFGVGVISTSFIKTLGKTLCLCLVALAMDLVWGYCGILSLGHMAFFGLGGYAIGMWLMYARTEIIVLESLSAAELPPTPEDVSNGIATQIFGVVGSSEFPPIWAFAHSLPLQLAAVVIVPGLLALVFGWLAFRSRVTGVYLSILTQAMTLALSLHLFQNDSGLRGNNGLSGLQNLPGLDDVPQATVSLWFFWASALALGLGYVLCAWIVSGKFGSVIRAIRDDEARVRFLGYPVEAFKLVIFTLTAVIAGIAGALYYPQAGIINPAEIAPIASIYLAVWVAIGGRGRLYGAVIGAAFVSLVSTWFTGGQAPDINLGFYTISWVDWWTVLLGLSFVCVTLYAPKGIGGLIDLITDRKSPNRHGASLGPDQGSLRVQEAEK
jgi:urea transport system permease protein